ncbi:MAG: ATP-binding protein [Chloroflexi bacterium]|nr:ATP-binding protein [Chloroflexota bacterium]
MDDSFSKNQLPNLLAQDENGWLEFKREMYKVLDKQAKDYNWQKAELVKDILSLANGNIQSAGNIAYLIIGVENTRLADGSRELVGVEEFELPKTQLMDWVNAHAEPPLDELYPHFVTYQDTRLFIIEIPPSPYVHKLKKILQTGEHKKYPENISLMRVGEQTHVADIQQIQALQKAKQHAANFSKSGDSRWVGAVVGSLLLAAQNWPLIIAKLSDNLAMIELTNLWWFNFIMRLFAGGLGAVAGFSTGYILQEFKLFHYDWLKGDSKKRKWLFAEGLFIVVLTVVIINWAFSR